MNANDYFKVDYTGARTLQPGEEGEFTFTFEPTSAGEHNATASIAYITAGESVPAGHAKVNLSGNGNPPVARLEVSSDQLEFGQAAVGSRVEQEVVIKNTGSEPLEFSEATTIYGAGDFKVERDWTVLPPGEERSMTVIFEPESTGEHTAKISISYGPVGEAEPMGFVEINVSGNGNPPVEVSSDQLDFGQGVVGSRVEQEVVIKNTGSEPLEFSEATTIYGAGDFKVERDWTVLPPGEERSMTVIFEPEFTGEHTAKISISYGPVGEANPMGDVEINVSGNGG